LTSFAVHLSVVVNGIFVEKWRKITVSA